MVEANGVATDAALPWLVQKGLAELCKRCKPVRELVDRLTELNTPTVLSSQHAYMPDDDEPIAAEVRVWKLKVHCDQCNDTGVCPTPQGELLLSFFKAFVDGASVGRLDKCEEIPF